MSERWKFQLKYGLFVVIFINVLTILFDLRKFTLAEQLTSEKFITDIVFSIFLGIVLGYTAWKSKNKKVDKQ